MENNQEIVESAELNMMSAISHLETEIAKIRAGKANPIMLKGITVEYYGNMTPLTQVASVNTPNAQTISIQPWEKDMLDEIEKSIISSNLGLNPVNNGESLEFSINLANTLSKKPKEALSSLKKILKDSMELPLIEALRNEQEIFQSIVKSDNAIKKMREIQDQYFNGKKPKDIKY